MPLSQGSKVEKVEKRCDSLCGVWCDGRLKNMWLESESLLVNDILGRVCLFYPLGGPSLLEVYEKLL